ncbi:divalent cation tolerance protein CutA [Altererythrobacter luteolus]|uniref:Divalent cation tolerance protein CutA n=1 Tax=Pontixanthobacter luteolus TaxID=295089 RepID=A0A6I4V2A9_9SPHN|nr:divalent-cation tolerance protein CutA [Pontixanthobacter luteolus]MXP47855.1 divalent cation tolerance protein CutA [Pontixanthobacter luteolus]
MTALIWSPFANKEQAGDAATTLLRENLIGCANMMPIDSVFQWQGEIEQGQECGALFKTSADLLDQAVCRLEEIHPYETPAIAGWKCDSAAAATAAWLGSIGQPGE